MKQRTGDCWAGAATLTVAVLIYLGAQTFPAGGPEKMPQLIAAILAVCGVLLIIHAMRQKEHGPELLDDVNWQALWVLVVSWTATVLLLEVVGTFALLWLFMAGMNWFLTGRSSHPVEIGKAIGFATALTAVFWVVFVLLLKVNLPAGVLL